MNAVVSKSCIDEYVRARTGAPFYYSQAWHDLMRRLYRFTIIPLIAHDATRQLRGYLPLCYIRSRLTGSRLVSLPFSDNCPLLADDEDSANALVDQAIGLTKAKKVKYLELRAGFHKVLAQRSDLAVGNIYTLCTIPLTADHDALWQRIDRGFRAKISKAEKRGVRIRLARHRSEVAHYYRLHLLTRSKKHGVPAQPQRYFYELWDTFSPSGTMQLWLAEYNSRVIAASISFTSGTTCRSAYNASDESFLHLAPNHLLLWTEIKWAATNNSRLLDLGRTATTNEGLMQFKQQFGAVKELLPYYYYPSVSGAVSTSERSWTYQVLTKSWQRLPLQITGPLGGYLYPHLA